MKPKKVFIASDPLGCELKNTIKNIILVRGAVDLGSNDPFIEYSDIIANLCEDVIKADGLGILICKSGISSNIISNKVPGIRAVMCYEPCSASFARSHYNANVLCLGAHMTERILVEAIIVSFILTPFENNDQVNVIRSFENKILEKV